MGIIFRHYINVPTHCNTRIFGCAQCKTHLASSDEILSKAFVGQNGKAYLFSKVVNVLVGPPEERCMTTGVHTVRDVFCTFCNRLVGWKYDRAYESSQKYKEGRFILERQLVCEVV